MADLHDLLRRPATRPDRTVRYGPHPDQIADLWLPASVGPHALVVMLHGGFWRARHDRAHAKPMCAALATQGYAVCSLEYRRVVKPGDGWPSTFDDIAAGLDAVPHFFGGLVDSDRLVLLGHSAGAHLALWAAARHRQPPGSRWRRDEPMPTTGVVSLAGVCDLELASRLRLGSAAVSSLLGGTPDTQPERYAVADPMRLVPTGIRTILVHGDLDEAVPVEVSRTYAATARAAGDEIELRVLPGADHFSLIDPLSAAWPQVLEAVADVLRSSHAQDSTLGP